MADVRAEVFVLVMSGELGRAIRRLCTYHLRIGLSHYLLR
jgi:hypothetical protein